MLADGLCLSRDALALGLPRWLSCKEPACQCRRRKRCRFNPWVRKISWRRKWQPASVFLPGESHGHKSRVDYNPWRRIESVMSSNHFILFQPLLLLPSVFPSISCCLLFNDSAVSDTFATPWTVAHQAPLSMRFPRQEY